MFKLISDICETSLGSIEKFKPKTIQDIRTLPQLIGFSSEMSQKHQELKQFLRYFLYEHDRVVEMTNNAKEIIKDLFFYFINDSSLMPIAYQDKSKQDPARAVSDYLAGMTDRYAIKTHEHIKIR